MTRFRVTRKPLVNPQGPWLKVSHEITWAIEDIADREDLVVKISPDAGFDDSAFDDHGKLIMTTDKEGNEVPQGTQHPGVTFPQLGIVELNAHYVPDDVDPATMHPLMHSDRSRYPVIWGLVHHEGAHAAHSLWMDEADRRKLKGEQIKWAGAATILEESRIEKIQMETHPQAQKWLQASGMNLALEEIAKQVAQMKEERKQDKSIEIDKPAIARAAALVLARIDAGSVIPNDASDNIEALVRNEFSDEIYSQMQRIWNEAHQTADDDTDRMLDLGRQWYELTGDAGGQTHQDGDMQAVAVDAGDLGELGKALKQAAAQGLAEANGEADSERRKQKINLKVAKLKAEGEAREEAQRQAQGAFAGQGSSYDHPVKSYRDPTGQEMTLARLARRWLEAAYVPERAVTRVNNQLPPGRLVTRAAMQGDAQMAAGLMPDAAPFTHKDRRHVPTPPLKVGIVQDVSGSQGGPAAAAVSGAWSLAKGTSSIEDAQVAMASFGDSVNAIFKPNVKMPKVPVLSTNYGTRYFLEALQAVEGVLNLTRSDSARLVVILTDGYLDRVDLAGRDAALKRLVDFGVHILWLRTSGDGDDHLPGNGRMQGVHVYTKAANNFDIIPKLIVTEAVNALKK
jgi:hypothetical protein